MVTSWCTRWGKLLLPLTSRVGFELASRTGPCQATSKKHLIVMFAGDVEKSLVDGVVVVVWRSG